MTGVVIYDDEIPPGIAFEIGKIDGIEIIECGLFEIWQTPVIGDITNPVAVLSNPIKKPWQNATPYLKRKKGRS